MRPTVFASAALLALGLPIATFAAGGGADPPKPVASTPAVPADPAFAQAKAMVDQKNYAGAIPLLQQVVQRNPRNADAYNLLGYSTRASGNANGSLQYYQQALRRADAGAPRFALRLRLHRVPHAQGGGRRLQAGQEADELTRQAPPPCSARGGLGPASRLLKSC